jgi:hypothetical protein
MRINTQRGIAPFIIIAIVAILAVGGGTAVVVKQKNDKEAKIKAEQQANANATSTVDVASTTARTLQVKLNAQNNSGQSGQAVITEANGKVKVIVNLTGKPSTVAQPSHIHIGSCATIGGVKYPLTNVDKGSAQTTIDITLADLLKQLPLAINVHKSAAEASVYVACGDILASSLKIDTGTSSAKVKVNATSTVKVKPNATSSVNANVNANVNVQY